MTAPSAPAPPLTTGSSQTGPTRTGPTLEIVVFAVGMASLGAEIAAARLLAPWFGASTIVWANTIATVLVALSVGYAVGGRVADRNPTLPGLSRIVLISAGLLALVPFISGPFLKSSVSAFDHLSAGLFVGSLVGVGVLIAVPVFLLGMVSPYAVRLKVVHVEDAGRAAGRLYAISTVGSLVGTFLASLLLIPVVGTRRTFLIFALALALAALLGMARGRLFAVAVSVGIVLLMVLPVGATKAAASNGKVIWEKETEYQYARVIQAPDGRRSLELNEGQAVHSVYREGEWLTGGYWDEMLVLPFSAGKPPKRIAILGSAAGSTARALAHYFPDVRVDAVEIDPDVTAVGRKLFDLRGKSIHTHTADARPWLQASDQKYDAILVDAYRQPYIPFYLATREFFDLVRDRLTPGGVVAINVGHPEGSDKLEKNLSASLAAAMPAGRVWRDPVDATNTMVLGTIDQGDPRIRLQAAAMPSDLTDLVGATSARLVRGLRGGTVWTDDKAPVEWLVDASLAEVATQ